MFLAAPGFAARSRLPSESRDQVQDRREQQTHQKRRTQGREERETLPAVGDIAGQPAKGEPDVCREQQQGSKQHKQNSNTDKCLAQFTHVSVETGLRWTPYFS